jgi:PhzF family phenazine biosynthesis protein
MRFHWENCSGFTRESTGGNGAGVVLPEQDRLLVDSERQAIARMLNFSETVFVSSIVEQPAAGGASVEVSLRYFTPVAEVDLCGHATIACLGLLHTRQLLCGASSGSLHTRAGRVQFLIEAPAGAPAEGAVAFMEQLAPTIEEPLTAAQRSGLAAALGVASDEVEQWAAAVWPPRAASTGLKDLLLGVPSLAQLRALRPVMPKLAALSDELGAVGLHVFCAADGAEPAGAGGAGGGAAEEAIDFHVRNFAPLFGIDEESATGTSNCALACALRASGALPAAFVRRDAACRLYGTAASLVFAQGDAMEAPSRILARLPPPTNADEARPWVGGRFALHGAQVSALPDSGALPRCLRCLQPAP